MSANRAASPGGLGGLFRIQDQQLFSIDRRLLYRVRMGRPKDRNKTISCLMVCRAQRGRDVRRSQPSDPFSRAAKPIDWGHEF